MTEKVTTMICWCLFRVLLPLTLLAAAIFRYNGFSFMYLLFLLITPLLPYPMVNSMAGHTGRFLKVLVVMSALPVLAHIIFHITLVAMASDGEPYGSIFPDNCTQNEMIARQIGLQSMAGVSAAQGVRLILPDVAVLIVSIVVLVVSLRLVRRDHYEEADLPLTSSYIRRRRKMDSMLNYLGEFFVGLMLAVCAIMVPSILSSVYFLVFLVLAIMWGCYQSLGTRFAYFRIILMVYTGLHILVLYLYQFQFFQDALPKDDMVAKLMGLTAVVKTDCDDLSTLLLHSGVRWMVFVNPGVLLMLYWVLAFETTSWYKTKNLTPEEIIKGNLLAGQHRRPKRKRSSNSERQVPADADMDEMIPLTAPRSSFHESDEQYSTAVPREHAQFHEDNAKTGSLVFSGSAYGDDGGDEERLVDEGENLNYNSLDQGGASSEPGAGTSRKKSDSPSVRDSLKGADSKRAPLVSVFMFAMKQSYVLMLIAMMAWSIMYLSWLTFVLLLGACILWMLPNSRRACLVASPVLVLYTVCLLICQYIWNMDVDLPTKAGSVSVKEIGLVHFDVSPKDLAFQIFFAMFFLMTMRQFMRERRPQDPSVTGYPLHPRGNEHTIEGFSDLMIPDRSDYQTLDHDEEDMDWHYFADGYDSATVRVVGHFMMETMSKYWIFVCAGMLLLMAVQEVVIYRIIYMVLFLLFITMFQLSYPLWRALMFAFWWLVILYSMIVLIIIYTYQFEKFPSYWEDVTGWDNATLADIGLETFGGTELFVKLLTPTSFLIVIILQVHYFHKSFLRLSALDRYTREEEIEADQRYTRWFESMGSEAGAETEDEPQTSTRLFQNCSSRIRAWCVRTRIPLKIMQGYKALTTFLWRLAEIHVFKLVIIIVMFVAVYEDEVSAMNAIYVILVALLLPFILTKAHLLLSNLVVLWTSLIILVKMIYQLNLITATEEHLCDKLNATLNVTHPNRGTLDRVWIGLQKISDLGWDIDYYIRLYILVLAVVLFESIVRYHQRQHFNHPNTAKLIEGILFNNIGREDADKGILPCLKFFANYTFYKFGLEICYVAAAVTVCVRMDVFGVLYAVMLGVMMLFSRSASARIWWLYMLVLAVLLPIQYFCSLGFPPIACIVYPWHDTAYFTPLLERWLYLPDLVTYPPSIVLMADAMQLLFVVLQWHVFRMEATGQGCAVNGGDNKEILEKVESRTKIPVEDFTITTTKQKTGGKRMYLDVCKQAVYEYMFWVTLAIVFIAGATRVNIFGLGYVISVFCFMWYGKEFLLKPLRRLLRLWNFLIAYVMFVVFAKACLQLVGCVYVKKLYENNCWVVQLFGINCLLPTQTDIIKEASDEGCLIVEDNTGLTWDVVCFAFLLLQRRIYGSHYFRHVVDLLEAQHRLSSRGAELINRILVREVEKQRKQEEQILVDIKKKMASLKSRQAELRKDFKEPTEHFQAIRGGDYYLFDEEELEKDGKERVPDSLTYGTDHESPEDKRLGPLQVINTAVEHGAEAAVEKVKQQDSPDTIKPESLTVDPEHTKEEDPTAGEKVKTWGSFFATLIGSVADWLIRLCNKISRNYRLVAQKLEGELKVEKEKIKERYQPRPMTPIEMNVLESRTMLVSTSNPTFTPDEPERAAQEREKQQSMMVEAGPDADEDVEAAPDGAAADSPKSTDLTEVVIQTEGTACDAASTSDQSLEELEKQDRGREEEFEQSQTRPYRMMEAIVNMLISQSELLCYFLMILDQMIYGSLLSLPLPFMVFLWGMLSVPRPSKTFWITVITYTEVVVVTKYLFQFGFFPWNNGKFNENPFYPPRILGIEQTDNYANVDIALLLALFIHRSILKRYGLWKDAKDITEDMERAEHKEKSHPRASSSSSHALVPSRDGEPDEVKGGETAESLTLSQSKEEPGRLKKTVQTAVAPFVVFFKEMTSSTYNATVDVYAPMFCCDFINFFIVVFGYWAFGPVQQSGDGDVTSYITENRVPVPFLIMLIVQFILIVIDRALFLRKNVMGKCIFQILLVILIHIWMFFVLPKVTGRSFFDNKPAQLWYFVKCVYFALSAYQIRCGYPTRILGNFLTKKYNYLNLFLFQGFLAIPFLLELRALMDWIWTDSTLAIGSWLQMEDIYANIFVLKCWRHSEAAYPTPRAQKKKPAIKYGVGGLLLFIIILIIWFPLVIFAFANTVFEPNPPSEVTLQLQLGAYQPIFRMTIQQSIRNIKASEKGALMDHFAKDRNAISFLNRFELEDVSVISFNGESTSIWGISEPSQLELIEALNNSLTDFMNPVSLEFSLTVLREGTKLSQTSTQYFFSRFGLAEIPKLIDVIRGTSNDSVRINDVFPRFMQLTSQGISEVKPLISGALGFGNDNLEVGLSGDVGLGKLNQYWTIKEEIFGGSHFNLDKRHTPSFTRLFQIITFNDRKAPSTLSFLSGYGIIGLYVSFILLIGRFLRMATTGKYLTIIFRELPDVDNALQLCLDIYLVREMKEFHLEEDLYAKLIFLYRSPETLIKWTRAKPKTE